MCFLGYRREIFNFGLYSLCVFCVCNGYSEICDFEIGVCNCRDNMVGLYCEKCSDGYYGDLIVGIFFDC